ncbi:hypothetical protein OC846_006510 [Tilletia horrida]|uniref:Uncharacterized protein n=1 Tax=Tilletia horrida TaxID=155126 RepID=A0AAN6GNI6_9BASI|nr:hypothetical protein OC845_006534 [Tilletia horrida]KAK0543160.1 hypothetical protein OC846_006510 [Tilletia horrida]KAK0562130.1 hypothetical protein OC861_005482 [Tilletia horrida]
MSTGNSRTIIVHQTRADLISLGNYNLGIGQEFQDARGQTHTNVLWKSHKLAPKITIEWNVKYALQWTKKLPHTNRAKVTYEGEEWFPCKLDGKVGYQLDKYGFWVENGVGTPGSVQVNDNAYGVGIHVVVGLYDVETESYLPVFIDTNDLLPNGSGTYTPTEITRLWYEVNATQGTFIAQDLYSYGQFITSKPNENTDQYVWEGKYDPRDGKWGGDIRDVRP